MDGFHQLLNMVDGICQEEIDIMGTCWIFAKYYSFKYALIKCQWSWMALVKVGQKSRGC